MTVTRSMVHGAAALAAAAISFVLAMAGWGLWSKWQIHTPGIVIAGLAAQSASVSLGGMLFTQLAVDFVFWFTLMFGIYLLIAKVLHRSGGP